ncbi:hypothetical protein AURDEDRAFT_177844 [Auricularia subglabra TFB-10046 SS5]|uniref:Uncharacterized protein n=1 Tax=Auricularia subglabra (strain TFB-10046 / SS5) TaxID=717982 RepID=J0WMM7_AURST|nr:hypothetical protein AURDEDRAFT_177844 [Auricularia subglabra TFB-10046 SS5]
MAGSQWQMQLGTPLFLRDPDSPCEMDASRGAGDRQYRRNTVHSSDLRPLSDPSVACPQRADDRLTVPRSMHTPRLPMPPAHPSSERNRGRSHHDETPPDMWRRVRELEAELLETRNALAVERHTAGQKTKEVKELVIENSRLRFELDGVHSMQTPMSAETEPESEATLTFASLNRGVLEFALQISHSLHPHDLMVRLHPSRIDPFLRRNVMADALLRPILMRGATARVPMHNVIVPVCRCMLNSFLSEFIFWPYFPGLLGNQNGVFYNLKDRIYAQQPQRTAALWRSITYEAVASDRKTQALATHVTQGFFSLLADLLQAMLPPENFVAADVFPKLVPGATALVLAAMGWQDTARMRYTSYERPDDGGSDAHGAQEGASRPAAQMLVTVFPATGVGQRSLGVLVGHDGPGDSPGLCATS